MLFIWVRHSCRIWYFIIGKWSFYFTSVSWLVGWQVLLRVHSFRFFWRWKPCLVHILQICVLQLSCLHLKLAWLLQNGEVKAGERNNWRSQLSTMHRRSKTESPLFQEKRQVRLTECNNRTYSRLRETSCTKIHPTRNPTCLTERNSRLFRIQFPYKHELDWNKICGNASFVFGNLKIKIVRKFLQVMYVDFSKNDVQVVNFST